MLLISVEKFVKFIFLELNEDVEKEILKLAEYEKKHHHPDSDEQPSQTITEQPPQTDNPDTTYYGA